LEASTTFVGVFSVIPDRFSSSSQTAALNQSFTREKWFCYGNKIRDNKYFFFVAATKNFAAATKRFVDRTKHLVVTKHFCYPYFNK